MYVRPNSHSSVVCGIAWVLHGCVQIEEEEGRMNTSVRRGGFPFSCMIQHFELQQLNEEKKKIVEEGANDSLQNLLLKEVNKGTLC